MSIKNKSVRLSYLLRHKPEDARLTLDKEGWCSISELISNADFSRDELEQIVQTDEKGRYTIKGDYIRANQGHSTDKVKISFKKAVPPTVLYHGTNFTAYEQIKKTGLLPMSRHHVHLTDNTATAKMVGGRRKKSVCLLMVNTAEMLKDGIQFYVSDNGVWLVNEVPPKYISEIQK